MPGSSGFRSIPRKIAGSEMITIEELIVAISIPSVVLVSAIHRYLGWSALQRFGRRGRPGAGGGAGGSDDDWVTRNQISSR